MRLQVSVFCLNEGLPAEAVGRRQEVPGEDEWVPALRPTSLR